MDYGYLEDDKRYGNGKEIRDEDTDGEFYYDGNTKYEPIFVVSHYDEEENEPDEYELVGFKR